MDTGMQRAGAGGAKAAAWQVASADDIAPAAALVADELSAARGAGLDSQPPSAPGPSGGIAVILWDDFPDGEGGNGTNGIVGAGNISATSSVGRR